MADRYLKATGNYSAVATWSATDGGAAGASAPTSADNVYITANGNGLTLTLDAASAAALVLCSGATTATLAGTQTWTIGGNVTLLATMTIPNTITFTITGTGNFAGSTLATLGAINLNGTAHTVSGAFTCVTLTRNGTATKTDSVTFTSGVTLTCTTFAMIGNSATNRLLVKSSTLGTAATITATNWTGTVNVDIMDITATNAVNLSAITGLSGDCGGNTGITFTTTDTLNWKDTDGGNWSDILNWTKTTAVADRVPLPQDTVTFNQIMKSAQTFTVDMPRIGGSVSFAAMTDLGTDPVVSLSNDIFNYGSFTLISGLTYTHNSKVNYFRGRGSYTLTSAGKSPGDILFSAPTGTYTLQDNLAIGGASIKLTDGTLDFNDKNVSAGNLMAYGSNTRTLNMGNGIITLIQTWAGDKVFMIPGGLIFNAEGSTIILTSSGATGHSFVGAGLTYNNVTVTGAGNYALTITGNNTFNVFTLDRSVAAKTITLTAAATQIIRNLQILGYNKNVITISAAATSTIQGNTGYFEGDYLALTNVVATNKYLYFAGDHSTDNGGNTNWIFRHKVRQQLPRRAR